MKFTFKEKDLGWEELKREAAKLKSQPSIKVGVVGEKASEKRGGITMGELATVQEFGSPKNNVPERSFIRSTMEAEQNNVTNAMGKGLGDILEGKTTAEAVLTGIGQELVKKVKARIEAGIDPALKKGKRTPLIDTGRLLDAINFEVVPNGKDIK